MFTFHGQSHRHPGCVNRRSFLIAGGIGWGALTLADLLRLESHAGIGSSSKSIINIHLDGGPPQMDTIDLKPNAPSEIRGEFQPIATVLPGFQVCELMPKLASIADRFAFIRSLVGSAGRHDGFQTQSGFHHNDMESVGGRPAVGCILNKLLSAPQDVAPTFVDLMQGRPLVRNSARPGFLGPAYKPFRPDISSMFQRPLEAGMQGELARLGANHSTSLSLNAELNADRLENRAALLSELDRVCDDVDNSGMMDALDRFHQQAAQILTSGQFANALDLESVPSEELDRYTAPISPHARFTTAEDHRSMRKFLLARRLIEVGVRCVSVSFSDFDTHSDNFGRMKHMLPILDHGLHALITDLESRGMLDDVSVVVWGEFGRTPKINSKGGRDHWPRVGPALLAGGGLRVGQVIGATDRTAGAATQRPVTYKEVFATLYRNLGIDATRTTIVDPSGRPQYLLADHQPIAELV